MQGAREELDSLCLGAQAGAIADPDAALVTEARGGCLEVFEALIRRHTNCVYRTLMAILGDPHAPKDAMQDAFLSAFKHISNFEGRLISSGEMQLAIAGGSKALFGRRTGTR